MFLKPCAMNLINKLFSFATFFWLAGCMTPAKVNRAAGKEATTAPTIVGEMRNVMQKGQLRGVIDLDSLSHTDHLYGLGPVENLAGEIMILNGIGYKATVKDGSIAVVETFKMKAPFFGYATIEAWTGTVLPDSVTTFVLLEQFLSENSDQISQPFFFRLTATIDSARIHIMDLPEGAKISSPQEAHALGKKPFTLTNQDVELLGFFSTAHKSIFTHHNSLVHIHLITRDKKQMGHLDDLNIRSGNAILYLPAR